MLEDLKTFYRDIIIEYFAKLGCGIMPDRLKICIDMIDKLNIDYTEKDIELILMQNIPYLKFK